jgi:hypothetical protein
MMILNHFVLRKLQSSLPIAAALLRNVAAAAYPLPERRFRPLFPLRAAALAEAAADKAANRSGSSLTSRRSFQRIDA